MEDINQVFIIGRLTRGAELKYTNSGMAIAAISIASNRRVKKNEQWVEEANFLDCTLFGKTAEGLSQHLSKGTQVAIIGSLVQDRWGKDGQIHSKIKINVDRIQLLGSAKKDASRRTVQNDSFTVEEGFQDDTPF